MNTGHTPSQMGAPRARKVWASRPAFGLLLLALLGCVHGAPAAAPAAAAPASDEAPSIVGPLVPSDLALLSPRAHGLQLEGQRGGTVHALAAEPERPIVWASTGMRVVSYAVDGGRVRPLGRSPVLPGVWARIYAGDGIVVAIEEGPRGGAWLIDGRDPAWPRAMRRLDLGGTVRGVAVEGRAAVALVGHELLKLDLEDPAAPRITSRTAIERLRDEPNFHAALALSGRTVAMTIPRNEVLVFELDVEGPAALQARVHVASTVFEMQLGDGLLVVSLGVDLVVYDWAGDGVPSALEQPSDFASSAAESFVVHGSTIHVLWRDLFRGDARLQTVRWSAERQTLERAGPVIDLVFDEERSRRGRGLPGTHLTELSSGELLVLAESLLHVIPTATEMGKAVAWPEGQELEDYGAETLAAKPGLLAVGERGGVLALWDTSHPDATRRLWRWRPKAQFLGNVHYIQEILFVSDVLWLTTEQGYAAIDVADPHQPHVLLEGWRGSGLFATGDMVVHEDTVFIAVESGILSFDGHHPGPPRHRLDLVESPSRLAVIGNTLWVATRRIGSTRLGAFPLLDGVPGMEIASYELPFAIGPMAGVGPLLVVLMNRISGSTEFLRVMDASDPFDLRALGELDIGASLPGSGPLVRPPEGTLIAFGHGVALAHHETGALVVDLRLPEQPDEVARLALPGGAGALAAQGERLWVGSQGTGVYAARWAARRGDEAAERAWLPCVGACFSSR